MMMMRLVTSLLTAVGWEGLEEKRTIRPCRRWALAAEMRVPVPV